MILGPVSLVDCLVFCVALAPQLLLQVGLVATLRVVVDVVPFLVFQLPYQFLEERYWRVPAAQTAFVRGASAFEDFVVRCVRYAFKYVDASVGRVFFSKHVALPFIRWRMLRHGYLRFPTDWHECTIGEGESKTKGVWIMQRPELPPDFVLMYAHGGGFSMGSCFFYLEFLLAWHHLLREETGFKNPAIFALEYTLVPDKQFPTQLRQTVQGYRHVLDVVKDASKVCVGGDSAGGALVLSLLQEIGAPASKGRARGGAISRAKLQSLSTPQMCVLISPWITLRSNLHSPSGIDYLDRRTLWNYAEQYAGSEMLHQAPASPGSCADDSVWTAARPKKGYYVTYGEEEVLAADVENFLVREERAGAEIKSLEFAGGVHAWTVASLFLSNEKQRRLEGLQSIVTEIRTRFLGDSDASTMKNGAGWSD